MTEAEARERIITALLYTGSEVPRPQTIAEAKQWIVLARPEPETARGTERLQRIETAASILVSAVNAIMPERSPYGCPHSRDWLNGVLDDLRAALKGSDR